MIGPVSVLRANSVMPDLLGPDGQLLLLPTRYYDNMDPEGLRLWCHKNARYGLPTVQLIFWLREQIGSRSAIEIGAGHGDLSLYLGITATDSYLQQTAELEGFYHALGQPAIKYPPHVVRADAETAIATYKPEVVVASWVTQWIDPNLPYPPEGGNMYGVKEDEIVASGLTYIFVGNKSVHGGKKIMKLPHVELRSSMLRSRSAAPDLNRVWIWNR